MNAKKASPTTWVRLSLRWGTGVALVALMPKCLLCAVAYLGLGAMLGLAGPEICGASPAALPMWLWPVVAVSLGVGCVFAFRLRHNRAQNCHH